MSILRAADLRREFAPGRGVSGVSLQVERGECFALLGRNGSGKTTFTRLLLGLDRPGAGTLEVLDCDVGEGGRRHLRNTAAVLDTSVHWEQLSGRQNAWFFGRAHGIKGPDIERRLDHYARRADLLEVLDDPVASYSFGMRRKLSIIEALGVEPDLLALDEPTTGVDVHFLPELADIARRRSEAGKTTWIASNDAEWVAGVASRVAFIEEGRIVAEGTVAELIAEIAEVQRMRVVLDGYEQMDLTGQKGLIAASQDGDAMDILLENKPEWVARTVDTIIGQGGRVRSLEVRGTSLTDAFLAKTGRTLTP